MADFEEVDYDILGWGQTSPVTNSHEGDEDYSGAQEACNEACDEDREDREDQEDRED